MSSTRDHFIVYPLGALLTGCNGQCGIFPQSAAVVNETQHFPPERFRGSSRFMPTPRSRSLPYETTSGHASLCKHRLSRPLHRVRSPDQSHQYRSDLASDVELLRENAPRRPVYLREKPAAPSVAFSSRPARRSQQPGSPIFHITQTSSTSLDRHSLPPRSPMRAAPLPLVLGKKLWRPPLVHDFVHVSLGDLEDG